MVDSKEARFRRACPVFLVADITSTMQWYRTVLGFEADPFPESPPHAFCVLTRDDIEIVLQQLGGYVKPEVYDRREGGVWNVYLRMRGVRSLFEAVASRSDVKMLENICEQDYGETEFVIQDPNGYVLVFAERE
jgi:predicted enzyme related to lactoylglutathione lyase